MIPSGTRRHDQRVRRRTAQDDGLSPSSTNPPAFGAARTRRGRAVPAVRPGVREREQFPATTRGRIAARCSSVPARGGSRRRARSTQVRLDDDLLPALHHDRRVERGRRRRAARESDREHAELASWRQTSRLCPAGTRGLLPLVEAVRALDEPLRLSRAVAVLRRLKFMTPQPQHHLRDDVALISFDPA